MPLRPVKCCCDVWPMCDAGVKRGVERVIREFFTNNETFTVFHAYLIN